MGEMAGGRAVHPDDAEEGEWREWIWAGAGLWLERVQFSNFTYRNRQRPKRPFGQRPLHNYCPHCPPPHCPRLFSRLYPVALSAALRVRSALGVLSVSLPSQSRS